MYLEASPVTAKISVQLLVLTLFIECVLSHIYNKNACILKRLESGHKELWGCVGAMGVR